jgi:hypothetical protein
VLHRFRHTEASEPAEREVELVVANVVPSQPEPMAPTMIAPTAASSTTVVVVTPPPKHSSSTKVHAMDPSAALAAWDAYLDAAPAGRFALEARYNRALCLSRLGRRSEAITELAPYAKGAHGNYRQHEAEQLIAALSREAP